ncbi:MAG: shikimate dehydrogenase [Negativicutes bacterium]|nr:shikimate dehydrogenase [Negativicutes bacterium]
MIKGKMRVVGLLGWPVGHTLSPVMQNAAFAAAGLDFCYVAFAVKPEELPQALAGAKALGFGGLNLTIPHKVEIMRWLDELDRSAQLVGAVNTVVFESGRAIGYNTDADGFVNSLQTEGVATDGKKVAVLGAGGAARAVVHGLLDNGVQVVSVGARDAAKAAAFAGSFGSGGRVRGFDWKQQEFAQVLSDCDILVQSTPVGMWPQAGAEVPLDWEALSPAAVVCDLIYNPATTSFLARAAADGHKTIGGAGMLVGQGAAAFTLWTGIQAPREVMRQALAEAQRESGRN